MYTKQLLSVTCHCDRPLSRHVLYTNISSVLRGKNVTRELAAQLLKAVHDRKPPSDLITEQSLAELKNCPHRKWEVEEVDVLVSHGKVLVTDGEDLGDLLRSPYGEMAEGEAGAVEYVSEAPHLVLRIPQ